MKSFVILIALLCSKITRAESVDKIGTVRYVVGRGLGIYPGFGLGHVVQGRYFEKGWLFTLGEAAFATVAVAGLGECGLTSAIYAGKNCSGQDKILIGVTGFVGFKLWEIVDVWSYSTQNGQTENTTKKSILKTVFLPTADGGIFALAIKF